MTNKQTDQANGKVVLFDFDGTISTLRAGWEEVMAPFMKEVILGLHRPTDAEEAAIDREIEEYIDQSTGIQTVYQMRWLEETVRNKGWNSVVLDEWGYKAEYNRRLLLRVNDRIKRLEEGKLNPDDFLMKGSVAFLQALQQRGVEMYIASGTDHPDVVHEAEVLGVRSFFTDIAGAPVGRAEDSKEKVIKDLLGAKGFAGDQLTVIGDGKVEIRLGKEYGGTSLGLASDEEKRTGLNPVKEKRLREAGADWITGDFLNQSEWLQKVGL